MKNQSSFLEQVLCSQPLKTNVVVNDAHKLLQTGIQVVESCGAECGEPKNVEFTPQVTLKVDALMKAKPSLEWLAYLVGKETDDKYIVHDLLIPKQKLSAATVELDFTEEVDFSAVVGTIHSHHNMGAFFSATDDNHIVPNYPVSVVVSTKGWVCRVRQKLPCGNYKASDTKLSMVTQVKVDLDTFLEAALGKMTNAQVVYPQSNYHPSKPNLTCLCCKRAISSWAEATWKGGAWYCQPCIDNMPTLTIHDWAELTDKLKAKDIAPKDTVHELCEFCEQPTPIITMKEFYGFRLCPTCYAHPYEER